jgi:RNA polymerase primary sigma factor
MRQLKITKSITYRDSDALNRYLQEVEREPRIAEDEEVILAQKIRKGDKKALEKLVKANLRFVISVAKQYQNKGILLPDLINEGNIGLVKAAEKFDERKGFKFITYAVWWIRRSITEVLPKQSKTIWIPANQYWKIIRYKRSISHLEQVHHRDPSIEEIAEFINIPVHHLTSTLDISQQIVSLDPVNQNEEDSFCLLDILENKEHRADNKMVTESLHVDIKRLMSHLSKESQEVIKCEYGIDCEKITTSEIANNLGISENMVSRLKKKAIQKMAKKKSMLEKYL